MKQKSLWWIALLAVWGLHGPAYAQQGPGNDGPPTGKDLFDLPTLDKLMGYSL